MFLFSQPASLQQQLDLDFVVVFPLLPVKHRSAGAEIVAAVFPVTESTEFGRSLPSFVASATASAICFFMTNWFAPAGV